MALRGAGGLRKKKGDAMRARIGRMLLGDQRAAAVEMLEERRLFGVEGGLTWEAYFPEGFASNTINEFVPITNHNSSAVQFELWAHYEVGTPATQLVASGTVAANSRGGVTISDSQNPGARVVRPNTPYALVLKASAPLSAMMSHYDFDTAIGESFTTETATQWGFAEGVKAPGTTLDFFLVYNPQETDTSVTITLFTATGQSFQETRVIAAKRRGGWSVNDITQQPNGAFSALITATAPVVASQSHYQSNTGRGYGAIGTPNGGANEGIITKINFDNNFYNRNGGTGPQFPADTQISILNSSGGLAVVTLTIVYEDPNLGVATFNELIGPQQRRSRSISEYNGIQLNRAFGVVYRSNTPVTVSAGVYQGMDGMGVEAATVAATVWDFGEGYMSSTRGGGAVLENMHIFNPLNQTTEATITIYSVLGELLTTTVTLAPQRLLDFALHDWGALKNRAPDQWYGIRVSAPTFIVAMFEHWDSGNGGGFATFGMPSGTVTPYGQFITG